MRSDGSAGDLALRQNHHKTAPTRRGESEVLFPSRFSSSFVAKAEARCAIVESRGKRVVPVKSSSFQEMGRRVGG